MKSLIKALYLNRLNVSERSVPRDSEYQHISQTYKNTFEKLRKHLSDEDNEILTRISELEAEIQTYEETEIFRCGFSLGVLLMAEVMTGTESCLGED